MQKLDFKFTILTTVIRTNPNLPSHDFSKDTRNKRGARLQDLDSRVRV